MGEAWKKLEIFWENFSEINMKIFPANREKFYKNFEKIK